MQKLRRMHDWSLSKGRSITTRLHQAVMDIHVQASQDEREVGDKVSI